LNKCSKPKIYLSRGIYILQAGKCPLSKSGTRFFDPLISYLAKTTVTKMTGMITTHRTASKPKTKLRMPATLDFEFLR